jgi:hypothetical protein
MLDLATKEGMLSKLPGRKQMVRASVYADDVVLFIKPSRCDINFIKFALHAFGDVTGLITNPSKSLALPIRCQGLDINHILSPLHFAVKEFPCTYLGKPLAL